MRQVFKIPMPLKSLYEVDVKSPFVLTTLYVVSVKRLFTLKLSYEMSAKSSFATYVFINTLFTHTEFGEYLFYKVISYFFTYYESKAFICIMKIYGVEIFTKSLLYRVFYKA
ncbi:hypothetical protein SAMN02910382_03273 [Butyrivibrio sp. TB]|nr:hypothetical protein SAMN02910382_03273 [Butyrivibrio sp. TB]